MITYEWSVAESELGKNNLICVLDVDIRSAANFLITNASVSALLTGRIKKLTPKNILGGSLNGISDDACIYPCQNWGRNSTRKEVDEVLDILDRFKFAPEDYIREGYISQGLVVLDEIDRILGCD